MAAPAAVVRQGAAVVAQLPILNTVFRQTDTSVESLLRKLVEKPPSPAKLQTVVEPSPEKRPVFVKKLKKETFHLGADFQIAMDSSRKMAFVAEPEPQAAGTATLTDPFEGLPLQRWAEALGERFLPAYEAIKQEQKSEAAAGRAGEAAEDRPVSLPSVPHFLPFTRWAMHSDAFRSTLISESGQERKKPRLSWYHPDDGMVPRDWWRGGLLEDLRYYRPFQKDE